MRLKLLRGRFWKYEAPKSFRVVEELAEADSVIFLCPVCFKQNNGPVGTHSIRIDFRGRNVPDHICMHNDKGHPVRWDVSGTSLENLTLKPSIQILGGCKWHGFITSGKVHE